MSKKIQDLSPERAALQNQVQDLHARYAYIGAYKETEDIVFHWREEFPWLPKFIRPYFTQRRSLQGPHLVKVLDRDTLGVPVILMVSDDREAGVPIGAVALYDEKTKEYTAFDFERGSSNDYHLLKAAVKSALEETRQQLKDKPIILSSAEFSERERAKKRPNDPNTPH
jgi:hypothetical protein